MCASVYVRARVRSYACAYMRLRGLHSRVHFFCYSPIDMPQNEFPLLITRAQSNDRRVFIIVMTAADAASGRQEKRTERCY